MRHRLRPRRLILVIPLDQRIPHLHTSQRPSDANRVIKLVVRDRITQRQLIPRFGFSERRLQLLGRTPLCAPESQSTQNAAIGRSVSGCESLRDEYEEEEDGEGEDEHEFASCGLSDEGG